MDQPAFPEHSPNLDYVTTLNALNEAFHTSYELLIAETRARLGLRETPVIVLLKDRLYLLHDGQQWETDYIPDLYHHLKAISHISFGIYVTLANNGYRPLDEDNRLDLLAKQALIRQALLELPALHLAPPLEDLQRQTLDRAQAVIEEVLTAGRVEPECVRSFGDENAPLYLENAAQCTRLEIASLHKAIMLWKVQVTAKNWHGLHVVVCGGHQARYRQTSMQYFQDLLDERAGSGAQFEKRVMYAEHIDNLGQALDLLARHMIDQHASLELFDDPYRLQEDLMSDGAEAFIQALMPD
jgi:hypothetical protein